MKDIIIDLEEKIRQAQLHNDVHALDDLLSPELRFIGLDGSVATKLDDLNAHRKKLIQFHDINFSDRQILELDDMAIVTVKAKINGESEGRDFHGNFRYLRTWAKLGHKWQVISGSVTEIKQ